MSDPLDQVLRLVAEGRLTAEEAAPIIDALEATGQTGDEGGETAADPGEEARLEILRALERGEIDIDEATNRLGELDGPTDV